MRSSVAVVRGGCARDDGEPIRGDGRQPVAARRRRPAITASNSTLIRAVEMAAASQTCGRAGVRFGRTCGVRKRRRNVDRNLRDRPCRPTLPRETSHSVVGHGRDRPQVGGKASRVELALLGDRVDGGLVVGVIAQPQPRVPALHAVVPRDVQAGVGGSEHSMVATPPILPVGAARLMR